MGLIKHYTYVGKTQADIVAECKARIKERYPTLWNDDFEDSAGVMIVEIFGYVFDLLLYYLDRQAQETYLPTARERQNVINICKLIGYTVQGAGAAAVTLKFTLDAAHPTDITIPRGTQIETRDGIVFELDADTNIPAGDTEARATATQWQSKAEHLGASDGTPAQKYTLRQTGIVQVTGVHVDDQPWTIVDSLLEEDSISQSCEVELGSSGKAVITFGDGTNGVIPPPGSDIRITYRVTEGAAGNVLAGTVTEMRDTAADTDGRRVTLNVTNPENATGGSAPESLPRVKKLAPKYFSAQHRCVTQEDYETIATAYTDSNEGRIAKCKAIVTEQTGDANVVTLYVLSYTSDGMAPAGAALKAALKKHISEYAMLTTWIEVADGSTKSTDITGTVAVRPGFHTDSVKTDIEAALTALLDPETREMGQTLRISDIYGAIENIPGVDYVELTAPKTSVTAEENQLITLGKITFTYTAV